MSTFWLLICFSAFIQSGFCNNILVSKIQDGIKYKGCSLKEHGEAVMIPDTGYMGGQGGSLQVLPANYGNGGFSTYPANGGYYGYGNYAPNVDYNYINYQTQPQIVPQQIDGLQGGNVIYMDSNTQGLNYGGATELMGGVNYGQGGLTAQTYPYYGYGQGQEVAQEGYTYGNYGGYGGYTNQIQIPNAQVQQYSG